MTPSFNARHEHDVRGLAWIHRAGWLRTRELGRLMWPRDTASRQRADRVARGWRERNFIIERPLPDHAGRALILARAGVELLREAKDAAYDCRDKPGNWHALLADLVPVPGTSWGSRDGAGNWQPPQSWMHDLLAAGVLTLLFEGGYQILPEAQIRRTHAGLGKVPDGFAWNGREVAWLEVEMARKTSAQQRTLVHALCSVAGQYAPLCINGMAPTSCLVALPADSRDERGGRIDHRTRIRTAIQRVASVDVPVTWVECAMEGRGVASISRVHEVVSADRTSRVLQILNSGGWTIAPDGVYQGAMVANYGDVQAYVWDAQDMGWWYRLVPGAPAAQADNMTGAMRACATQLANRPPPVRR